MTKHGAMLVVLTKDTNERSFLKDPQHGSDDVNHLLYDQSICVSRQSLNITVCHMFPEPWLTISCKLTDIRCKNRIK